MSVPQTLTTQQEATTMKRTRNEVQGKASRPLTLQFDPQPLTAFSGLILFQHLFALLKLKDKLRACFRHLPNTAAYPHHLIVLMLIVHLLLGFRHLRDVHYYANDDMVKRTVGLRHLPAVASISRRLRTTDATSVERLRALNRRLVLERLAHHRLARITLDFDGSVLGTQRHAEGTAVGFNKKKKGQRSYYPLFATIAQTRQVLDRLHRPGNVHDSNGARAFIEHCVDSVRDALPGTHIESRVDSAFYNEVLIDHLHRTGVTFTASVPFERWPDLKAMVEHCEQWSRVNGEMSVFETPWKPKCWSQPYRCVFVRKRVRRQNKQPIQLDLFVPHIHDYEFKVIVTNQTLTPRAVVEFHEGRGAQEGIFAEMKTYCQMEYIPVRTQAGNQTYLLAGVLAHNLTRELQMVADRPQRTTNAKRSPLWVLRQLGTIRQNLLRRVGRLTRPGNKWVLSINADAGVEREMNHYLDALQSRA